MVSLSPVGGVKQAGRLFALFLDVGRLTFKRPFQTRELTADWTREDRARFADLLERFSRRMLEGARGKE